MSDGNGCKWCVGGKKYRAEISRCSDAVNLLKILSRGAKVNVRDDDAVELEVDIVSKLRLKSDDGHLIALARESGARVVATQDKDLIKDLKNTDLLKPRGKILGSDKHLRLLMPR